MKPTDQQLQFFNTFGYLSCPGALNATEVAEITDAFEIALRDAGGTQHDGSKRTMMLGPIDRHERLCRLLDHPAVVDIAGALIGEDFNYASGDGNYYTGDTSWHSDGAWGEVFAIKVAFYLDPVDRDTGALRVIPGSQRPDHFVGGRKINPNESLERFGVPPREFPGNVALTSRPGDVVFFNHDLWHASFGGGNRRRMFTMNLTRRAHDAREQKLIREYCGAHSPGHYGQHLGAGMYT